MTIYDSKHRKNIKIVIRDIKLTLKHDIMTLKKVLWKKWVLGLKPGGGKKNYISYLAVKPISSQHDNVFCSILQGCFAPEKVL